MHYAVSVWLDSCQGTQIWAGLMLVTWPEKKKEKGEQFSFFINKESNFPFWVLNSCEQNIRWLPYRFEQGGFDPFNQCSANHLGIHNCSPSVYTFVQKNIFLITKCDLMHWCEPYTIPLEIQMLCKNNLDYEHRLLSSELGTKERQKVSEHRVWRSVLWLFIYFAILNW